MFDYRAFAKPGSTGCWSAELEERPAARQRASAEEVAPRITLANRTIIEAFTANPS